MNRRKTWISVGLLAFVLAFGAFAMSTIVAPQLEAAPISTTVSMNKRLATFKGNCQSLGGQMEVTSTTVTTNGPFVTTTSTTVTCKGGDMNGDTCTFTPKTTDCSKPLTRPTPLPPHTLPDTADPNAADPPAATPLTTDLADPGLSQVTDPGLPDPTPTPTQAPMGPTLRPTFEPVADPLN